MLTLRSINSRQTFMLFHPLAFFRTAWQMAVEEEKMSFNLCCTATYMLLTLWKLPFCIQTCLPGHMLDGE